MYAIIEQGGKQYKVSQGDVINIDLVEVDPEAKSIEIGKVLFFSDGENVKIGSPYLDGAKVTGVFKDSADDSVVKGPKLYPSHRRRRKNSARKVGHRQKYMQIVIETIEA